MAAKKRSQKAKRPKKVTVAHEQAAGYRTVYADGTLIRSTADSVILTFYQDEVHVISQAGERIDFEDGTHTFRLAGFEEEPVRTHQMAVRIPVREAVALATSLLERLQKFHPEALQGIIVEKLDEDTKSKTQRKTKKK